MGVIRNGKSKSETLDMLKIARESAVLAALNIRGGSPEGLAAHAVVSDIIHNLMKLEDFIRKKV